MFTDSTLPCSYMSWHKFWFQETISAVISWPSGALTKSLQREGYSDKSSTCHLCMCQRDLPPQVWKWYVPFCRSPGKPRIHAVLLGEIPGECDISHTYRDVGMHTWNVRAWEKHYTLSTHPQQLLLLIVNRERRRCPHMLVQWMMADMNTSIASVFYGVLAEQYSVICC